MKRTCYWILLTGCLLLSFSAIAYPLTNSWQCPIETGCGNQVAVREGETRVFEISYTQGTAPFDLSWVTSAVYHWQAPGMGRLYWSVPASIDPKAGIVRVTWTPAMDNGAERYSGYVGLWQGNSPLYPCEIDLIMQPTPGFIPNMIALPAYTIDFSRVVYTNAPWATTNALQALGSALATAMQVGFSNVDQYAATAAYGAHMAANADVSGIVSPLITTATSNTLATAHTDAVTQAASAITTANATLAASGTVWQAQWSAAASGAQSAAISAAHTDAAAQASGVLSTLTQPNNLTLYGSNLYATAIVPSGVFSIPYSVVGIVTNQVTVYAGWNHVIIDCQGNLSASQIPTYGRDVNGNPFAYGPYAWVVDSTGTNYDWAAMESWTGGLPDGDSFVDIGPDNQPSCQWQLSNGGWLSSGVQESDPHGGYFYPVTSDNYYYYDRVGPFNEQDTVTPIVTVDTNGNISYEIPWAPQQTNLEQYAVACLSDGGTALSFTINCQVGLPDVFLTEWDSSRVYSFNTQVFSWDSNNWSGWNPFTTPWEVTGEPIFAISCNENWYGDTIDNPCAGGSTGLVSVGSAYVTSLQGYVMVPGFVKVPTTLDVSNMISAAISAYINSLNR